MTFVVTENCIRCKYTDCVEVCPVDAIYAEDDLPEDQKDFIQLNADLSRDWPVINTIKPAMDDAEKWNGAPDKRQYLEK